MKEVRGFFRDVFKPDAFATFLNYGIKLIVNPLIIIFIPLFLTENEQGYWYTFGSLAALTTFADLGFTTIMTQFASHEYAYLELRSGRFEGLSEKKDRLCSLFRFVVRWVSIILSVAAILIFVIGIVLFRNKTDGIEWLPQWTIYVVGTIINFAVQILFCFFEGCDQFKTTQKIRALATTLHGVVTILVLALGGGLYALGLALMVQATIGLLFLLKIYGSAIRQMIQKTEHRIEVKWTREIVPLLGKYAISWISGYLAMQIYNPLAFAKYGSAIAGRIGYCLSVVSAINSIASVWNTLAIPKYNFYVERKEWSVMDSFLKKNIIYALTTFGLGVIALFSVGRISLFSNIIWGRLPGGGSVLILSLTLGIALITSSLASYLRAHKKEPFMWISVINGCVSASLTLLFCEILDVKFIFLGYLIANLISLPLGISIWKKSVSVWHAEKI